MIKKDKDMTFDDLVKLPRLKRDCKDGQPSLLGLWIKANEDGDTKMIDLTMSAMVEQSRIKGLNSKPPGQFPKPMLTKSDKKESNADRSRRLNTMRSILGQK
jgi:hypothetical protein|tara:strand:- start:108 stop:413 length:306 start_codon:yes stop_codon:yes gene_type:complete